MIFATEVLFLCVSRRYLFCCLCKNIYLYL